ncbi:high light inducible protein [Pseudanabaenaceae cyanobacterium LEGE 13415]|nr:high light inducible protein [Pseudanabaenaceae cyanobacterium LEGE 13415]
MAHGQVLDSDGKANVFAIEPQVYVDSTQQFGFNEYAEKLNGRLAMIGFVSALILEAVTGQGVLSWLFHLQG